MILKNLTIFLELQCFLNPRQHRFRKRLSTTTQLLEAIHAFAAVLDEEGQIDICLYFEEAIDRVSHIKLLIIKS